MPSCNMAQRSCEMGENKYGQQNGANNVYFCKQLIEWGIAPPPVGQRHREEPRFIAAETRRQIATERLQEKQHIKASVDSTGKPLLPDGDVHRKRRWTMLKTPRKPRSEEQKERNSQRLVQGKVIASLCPLRQIDHPPTEPEHEQNHKRHEPVHDYRGNSVSWLRHFVGKLDQQAENQTITRPDGDRGFASSIGVSYSMAEPSRTTSVATARHISPEGSDGHIREKMRSDLQYPSSPRSRCAARFVAVAWLSLSLLAATKVRAEYEIEVNKTTHMLVVKADQEILETFKVSVGRGGPGDKLKVGDKKTPVGTYRVTGLNASSRFDTFIRLNYPNVKDAFYGLRNGVISRTEFDHIVAALDEGRTPPQDTDLGGAIGIHGIGEETPEKLRIHENLDWTEGCIALTNSEVRQLKPYLALGTRVVIRE